MLTRGARRVLIAVAAVGISGSLAIASSDPCDGVFAGANLSASLLDISLTLNSLKLLNGSENPKLKHMLEWRLASAIQSARRFVDNKPVIDPVALPMLTLNSGHEVSKARAYISSHQLQKVSLLREGDPERFTAADTTLLTPSADLTVVEKWLARQPLPPASER